MGIFAKLFKKNSEGTSSKNVEDFVSLTRVYFQSVIAANLGITNIRFVPDVANFKRLFKIPTQGGRLGQAEKTASRKMLMQDYGLSENFFKEIDASVKKHCRTQNDVQAYLFMLSLIHISEPTRQAEISYAVFCLKKKKKKRRTDGN